MVGGEKLVSVIWFRASRERRGCGRLSSHPLNREDSRSLNMVAVAVGWSLESWMRGGFATWVFTSVRFGWDGLNGRLGGVCGRLGVI